MDNASSNILSKKRLLVATLVLILAFALYWFSNTSFIVISGLSGKSTYKITQQDKDSPIIHSTNASEITTRVPRGKFEISISNGKGTFFSIVSTSGFYRKTIVPVQFKQERAREFIGNNPGQCIGLPNGVLVSFSCGGAFSSSVVHEPATRNLPTYTRQNDTAEVFGSIDGIVDLKSSSIALIKPFGSDIEGSSVSSSYALVALNSKLGVEDKVQLTSLDFQKTYHIGRYMDGVIVYDNSYSQVYYYSSIHAKPQNIPMPTLKNGNLSPVSFKSFKKSITALFSNSLDVDSGKKLSKVLIGGEQQHSYEFKKQYSSAVICGSTKLCLIGGKNMDVYDISGKKPRLLYLVNDVADAIEANQGLVIVNSQGVLSFNTESRSGYFEYSFGDYRYNSIHPVNEGYILTITNNKSKRVALLIDQGSVVSDKIDQKVEALQKSSEISFVNINGKYIYVSANLGPLVYDSSLQGYTYDNTTKRAAADKINAKINELGIDRKRYAISSNAF